MKNKDKDAFIAAYDLYVDDIYRFVFFKVGGDEEAKDITSAVFLKVWDYLQSRNLDESKSLRALLYKTARNLVIDHYRRRREKEERLEDDGFGDWLADENQNLEKQMEVVSDLELVKENLARLKDEYREIILMKFIDELSFSEIADITGKSKGNVRVLSFRALQALRELLEEK